MGHALAAETNRRGVLRTWLQHRFLFGFKDWIQIEVTSRCNAACTYCPRTVYGHAWQDRDMPLASFYRLVPALGRARLVYLQGWGEPLLHPDFFTMVELARRAGCKVGTTTNGMLVDRPMASQLVRSGLDILTFSLAGVTSGVNDRVRGGTRLNRVLEAVRNVQEARLEQKRASPLVHVAYMLLRSGLEELEGLPFLLAERGVHQVVVSGLGFEASPQLSRESIYRLDEKERERATALLTRVRQDGLRKGVEIHTPDVQVTPGDGVCPENVQRALFVSGDGEVSPCVYTNIPAVDVTCSHGGDSRPLVRQTFGNVSTTSLPAIWRGKQYSSFRSEHASGRLPSMCRQCTKPC